MTTLFHLCMAQMVFVSIGNCVKKRAAGIEPLVLFENIV